MKYAFLLERKPNFRATQWYIYFYFNADSNLEFNSTVFGEGAGGGGVQQFLNNQIFHANLMTDGCFSE